MATRAETDKLTANEDATERGYEAWKRAKVERGLAQARDRVAMIPVEQVWRDLKLDCHTVFWARSA